jgi:hypothetical protein
MKYAQRYSAVKMTAAMARRMQAPRVIIFRANFGFGFDIGSSSGTGALSWKGGFSQVVCGFTAYGVGPRSLGDKFRGDDGGNVLSLSC